jgi:glycosyltransferase involved in cell wall biosynthesis
MSLISVAIWDTVENNRSKFTQQTLDSLLQTVDFNQHRLFLCDNASCTETQIIYINFLAKFREKYPLLDQESCVQLIYNTENLGTANAINLAWKYRKPGEHCIKMDNDVVVHHEMNIVKDENGKIIDTIDWVRELEDAINVEPEIGIIGLKRKDVWEHPENENPDNRSQLIMLGHERGNRWIVVELVRHVIGTCQMYNSALLDKIGYLYQPTKYGFDDCLAAKRCEIAGFYNVFLPHINIDHIDPGGDWYEEWKRKHAGETMAQYNELIKSYEEHPEKIYYNPFETYVTTHT